MSKEPRTRPRIIGGAELLGGALVLLALLQRPLAPLFDHPRFQTWSTIFVSITVQALPFLVLGVLVSAGIAAWVSPAALRRVLPRQQALAVPVAGLAGAALPGCECGSVPVAGRLVARDVPPAAAVTFLLAAPNADPPSEPHPMPVMDRSSPILERLMHLHPTEIDLSLERILRLLETLGRPDRQIPPVIHVAGTNGKGSVCARITTSKLLLG